MYMAVNIQWCFITQPFKPLMTSILIINQLWLHITSVGTIEVGGFKHGMLCTCMAQTGLEIAPLPL